MSREQNLGTLQIQACAIIRQMIMDGRLTPGQPLLEMDLVEKLEMSRGPIREALVELEREGLIRRVGSRTRIVAEVTLEDLIDIYEIREMIEGMAARLFSRRISNAQIDELRTIAGKLDVPPGSDAVGEPEDEASFHEYIIRESGNPQLTRLAGFVNLQMLNVQVRELLERKGQLPQQWRFDAKTPHGDIVNALATHDPDRAEEVARAHLRENMDHLLNWMLGRSKA